MTNDEINTAVAESVGADCMTGSAYATWPMSSRDMLLRITVHVAMSDERDGRLFAAIPNFCNDLNAMHEVEKSLDVDVNINGSPRYVYAGHIYNIVERVCQPFRATARQRAEAYLRTIGKWRDA